MLEPAWRLLRQPAFDLESEAPCGTSVAEAREALAFWRARLRGLAWYRRGARAEARDMVARWRRRALQAQLERWRLQALTPPLLAVMDWSGPTRGVATGRIVKVALRASVAARMVALAAAAVAVTALALLALVIVAIVQLV
jgi:hypothetical protein